jgi:hypothetical protein
MINFRSSFRRGGAFFFACVAMLLALPFVASGASAQGTATVSVNSYSCPAGYDRISDCTKIGGVSVRVSGPATGVELTTVAESSIDASVAVGENVTIEVLGGAPAGSVLESTTLQFVAVAGSNPVTLVFVDPAAEDADGDGLADDAEAELGTDPNTPDSDGDGVQDGGEVNAGTDPLDEDSDDDGFTDFEELERATDPLDPASFPVDTEPNKVMVIAYNCPAGYEGKDPWYDCREPAEGTDFIFALWASEFALTATTDASGTVTFDDLGSGDFRLILDTDDLGFTLGHTTMHCNGTSVSPDAPEPRQVNLQYIDASTYGFTLTSGEEITCSWFNIPAGDDAGKPIPAPTKGSPVKRLPSTGSGTDVSIISDGVLAITGALATSSLVGALAIRVTGRRA